MTIAAIITQLEALAPASLQESYDNAGLITGSMETPCTGALVCLDATEEVIEEAISKKCNLVIAHHPIVFRGLKKITGKNYVERVIIAAIKNNIAIYAIHTNLDNVLHGVNGMIASKLGLLQTRVLAEKESVLRKLQVFVPADYAAAVRATIFGAGAGHIGNYSECSFNSEGRGTFKPGAGTTPFSGEEGKQQSDPEVKIETILPAWLSNKVLAAIREVHPYEEVAFDLLPLQNSTDRVGSGLIGELPAAVTETAFLEQLKAVFELKLVRHTAFLNKLIRRVAVCGGAGSFLITNALASGADVFVTADCKYHEFFDADGRILLADIGHYESEQFTIDLIVGVLQEKFPTFAALKTVIKTNPVHYFL